MKFSSKKAIQFVIGLLVLYLLFKVIKSTIEGFNAPGGAPCDKNEDCDSSFCQESKMCAESEVNMSAGQ
jgi:hypothetical protein